jgi:phosphoglycolate phosphatase
MHPNADNLIASRFDTVIYDLDGTLIDSARDMCVAVSRVLADHGLPPINDEDARQFMGEGSKVTMRRAFAKAGRTLDEAEASAVTRGDHGAAVREEISVAPAAASPLREYPVVL